MMHTTLYAPIAAIVLAACGLATAADRTQTFDSDLHWQGVNNRIVPDKRATVTQSFGYSADLHALGGKVTRASEGAFYADNIGRKTLDDHLSASGSFTLTQSTGSSGIFFGFFRAQQPGASGRPVCSLGLDMDGEGAGGRLAVRLITAQNQSCGTFITPYLPGKFRPTPIRNDGTRYTWTLDYDPDGANSRGQITFTFHGDSPKPGELISPDLSDAAKEEARKRFPDTTTFTILLPEGYKQQGTTFDHFGLMNMMKPGGHLTIFFDDLKYLDRAQDFGQDPKWDAIGNVKSYEASDVGGAQNFGFSDTSHAGGKRGEIGGTFWRSERNIAYYADSVGPLSLDDKLVARGRVAFAVGGPDSDMLIGWFSSKASEHQNPLKNFVGIHIGGPTRVGHYFSPVIASSDGIIGKLDKAPVIVPDSEPQQWSIEYDPGAGTATVHLDNESAMLTLKKRGKANADLDRFGVLTVANGGQMVKIYFDDITYTAGR